MKKLASLFAALVLMLALAAPGAAAAVQKPAASTSTARLTPTPPASSRSWPPGTGITKNWGCGTFSSRCPSTPPSS